MNKNCKYLFISNWNQIIIAIFHSFIHRCFFKNQLQSCSACSIKIECVLLIEICSEKIKSNVSWFLSFHFSNILYRTYTDRWDLNPIWYNWNIVFTICEFDYQNWFWFSKQSMHIHNQLHNQQFLYDLRFIQYLQGVLLLYLSLSSSLRMKLIRVGSKLSLAT